MINIPKKLFDLGAVSSIAAGRVAILENRVELDGKRIHSFTKQNEMGIRIVSADIVKNVDHGILSVHNLNSGQTQEYKF